ncbi:NAD(P)-dependent oxidoreductase [Pseudonocardia sp. GCM10023141]|uniref:NAD(P)-dependent oxidoreductase n=1 Tax=Pseudonocardia sp. GCM10023141 TaxID=3252653 RepID=UPI00361406A6
MTGVEEIMSVGFVGLGNLGGPIARSLVRNGFTVCGYDKRADAVEALVLAGGLGATCPADAVRGRDVLGVCVVNDAQVEEALFGPDGALTAEWVPRYLVIHSTIHPERCVEIADRAAERGVRVVDAPVSAGTFNASESGQLTVYAGGEADDIDAVRPVLQAIGRHIVPMGGVGTGQLAKLANNIVSQMTCLGIGEAVRMGVAAGLKGADILAAISAGSGRCWYAEGWPAAWMDADGQAPQAASPDLIAVGDVPGRVSGVGRNGLKDLSLACDVAAAHDVEVPFVDGVRQILEDRLRARGFSIVERVQ